MELKERLQNLRDGVYSRIPTKSEVKSAMYVLLDGVKITLPFTFPTAILVASIGYSQTHRDVVYDNAFQEMVHLADTNHNGKLDLGEKIHSWEVMGLRADASGTEGEVRLNFDRPKIEDIQRAIEHYRNVPHH